VSRAPRAVGGGATAVAAAGPADPRPVVCVIEHLHRDRSIADGVRAGRYRHAGVTLELGVEPDWRDPRLPADDEWRIEWSKFYEGLDLAHAYRETGDAGYLDAWVRLADSWIRQVPPGADPSDVIGRRVQNWVYAWQGFAAAPGFPGLPGGFGERLLASLDGQLSHLEANLTPERNHRTLELYGLLVVSLALPALDPDGRRARSALGELHRNLLTDVWPDGVHRECSTHYHMIALRSFVGARQNAVRHGLPVPDGYDDRLAAACRFAMHAHRPDGTIPAISDADSGSYLDVLERAAEMLDLPEARWVATAGRAGRPPAERHVSFPNGGYHVQRSGWGQGATPRDRERFLLLDCGPLGDGGHGHYDLLSVEIFGAGRPLVVDPGRYSYSEEGRNWRRWFKGTAAHNTVTVDRLDQTPYQRGKPKGPVAAGRLLARHTVPGLDVLTARAASPAYDAVHDRQVAFVADQYWLVADALRATGRHRYEQRWHLHPEAWGRTRVRRRRRDWVVLAPGLALVFPGPSRPRLEEGWVAEEYGVKRRAPVVVATRTGADAGFLTLVWPLADERLPVPRVRVTGGEAGWVAVTVEGVGAAGAEVDRIAWSSSGSGSARRLRPAETGPGPLGAGPAEEGP
jgi:Heparinase II/III-like protein/Heparinase II/III N-terminus